MELHNTLRSRETETGLCHRLHQEPRGHRSGADEIKASAEYDPKLEEAINTVFEEDEESDGYGEDD